MVRENLSEVQRADLAEAVETVAVAAGHSRIELRELEDFGDEIFGEVGETVVVGVVGDLGGGDAEEILPPIGKAVAVDVGGLREFRLRDDIAVLQHHAGGQIAPVRAARIHLKPVPGDNGIPLDLGRHRVCAVLIVIGERILLPPFGDAVERRAHAGVFPRSGRTVVVPHRLGVLGERAAEREHIVALLVEITTGKFKARLVVNIETAVSSSVVSLRGGIAVKVRKACAGCGISAEFPGRRSDRVVVDHLRPL